MKVNVITRERTGIDEDSATRKETDLALPGNRRWLMSHIRWATKFGNTVTIAPIF